jgi:hypothetical protein
MCAGPFLWIILAMAGVPAAPRGWHPVHEHACFFIPPPILGPELGHVCYSHSFSKGDLPQLVPSS